MKGRLTGLVLGAVLIGALGTTAAAQDRQGFRVTGLRIVDPHVFIDAFGTGSCSDITNPPGLLGVNVNSIIDDFIKGCSPLNQGSAEPCRHEFNLVAIFEPLIQTPGPGGTLQECMFEGNPCTFTLGVVDECIRSGGAVNCDGDFSNTSITTFKNAGPGQICLDALPGTSGPNNTGSYAPPIVPADGPCGASGEIELTLELGSDFVITIPLTGMELAAQYDGDPATGLVKGLARGFLAESVADNIRLNLADLTDGLIQATRGFGQLLPGPDKCDGGLNHGQPCSNITQCPVDPGQPAPQCVNNLCDSGAHIGLACQNAAQCPAALCRVSCAPAGFGQPPAATAQDDRDLGPGGEMGWWVYLGFEAEAVGVPEPPATPTPDVPPTATPTPTDTPIPPTPTDTPLPPTPTATPTPTIPNCPGDCNGNGEVTIGEVQTAANIFLGRMSVDACLAADVNRNGLVSIAEVVRAASSFRVGCP